MTHVFIVNDRTFKVHLEYLFAGTGANCDAFFLEQTDYVNPRRKEEGLTVKSEENSVAMIADVSRIRNEDKVIFYLEATCKHPGMFFGVFKVIQEAFYQANDDNYLSQELGKNLNYRILIEPDEVYSKGITEYEALDSLDGVSHPSEMCWSLIYRKLTGGRGCTMITDYEAEILLDKIKKKNNGVIIKSAGFNCDFETDETNPSIEPSEEAKEYTGNIIHIDILNRLLYKTQHNYAFEYHLQAYILKHIDKSPLKELINFDCDERQWIGNEVICSVGEQRIDLLIIKETETHVDLNVVELKCTGPYPSIVSWQIPRYIKWVFNYLVPTFKNKSITITPIIIAKKVDITVGRKNKEKANYTSFVETKLVVDNVPEKVKLNSLEYISFVIEENNIHFTKEF